MIVDKSENGYFIIMADSVTSEVVIKLKEEVARELRDRLDSLLPRTDIESLDELLIVKRNRIKDRLDPKTQTWCEWKGTFCEHAVRIDDGTKSGYYPNNDDIGNGCCGSEYCDSIDNRKKEEIKENKHSQFCNCDECTTSSRGCLNE